MDYYSILGVNKSASDADIRKAYKKQSMRHHPDRGGNEEEFKKINEAYSTLKDPQKRAEYDNPQPQFNFNSASFDGGNPFEGFGFPPGFEDLFMNGQRVYRNRRAQRNRDINLNLHIELEEVLGVIEKRLMYKLTSGDEKVADIRIPNGIESGQQVSFKGLGDNSNKNLPAGNLYVTVHVKPHKRFKRHHNDLSCVLLLNSLDAIIGTRHEIITLSGKSIMLSIPAGIKNGTKLRVTDEGINGGSLLVEIKLDTPKLNDNQIKRIKEIRDEIS